VLAGIGRSAHRDPVHSAVRWTPTYHRRLGFPPRDEGLLTTTGAIDSVFYSADDALVGAIPPALSFERPCPAGRP
jgi:hypothetical protein